MNLKQKLRISQIIISILLILAILLKSRGSGLSSVFGGEASFYRSKRGLEKGLFHLTIIFASLLITLSFVNAIAR